MKCLKRHIAELSWIPLLSRALEIVEGRQNRDRIRRFEFYRLHLYIHLLSPLGYLAGDASAVLPWLHTQAIGVKDQCFWWSECIRVVAHWHLLRLCCDGWLYSLLNSTCSNRISCMEIQKTEQLSFSSLGFLSIRFRCRWRSPDIIFYGDGGVASLFSFPAFVLVSCSFASFVKAISVCLLTSLVIGAANVGVSVRKPTTFCANPWE